MTSSRLYDIFDGALLPSHAERLDVRGCLTRCLKENEMCCSRYCIIMQRPHKAVKDCWLVEHSWAIHTAPSHAASALLTFQEIHSFVES